MIKSILRLNTRALFSLLRCFSLRIMFIGAAEGREKHLSRQMSAVSPVDGCMGRQGSLIVSGSPLNLGKCELMDGKAARTKDIPPASCRRQNGFIVKLDVIGSFRKQQTFMGKEKARVSKGYIKELESQKDLKFQLHGLKNSSQELS